MGFFAIVCLRLCCLVSFVFVSSSRAFLIVVQVFSCLLSRFFRMDSTHEINGLFCAHTGLHLMCSDTAVLVEQLYAIDRQIWTCEGEGRAQVGSGLPAWSALRSARLGSAAIHAGPCRSARPPIFNNHLTSPRRTLSRRVLRPGVGHKVATAHGRYVVRAAAQLNNRSAANNSSGPHPTMDNAPKTAGPAANAKIAKGKLLTGTSNLPQILYGCGPYWRPTRAPPTTFAYTSARTP